MAPVGDAVELISSYRMIFSMENIMDDRPHLDVMAGLVPAIDGRGRGRPFWTSEFMGGRDKPGHDV